PARVRAIPHGVDRPCPPARSCRRAESGRTVLALATSEPRKDLPTLVRAFDQIAAGRPDVRLVLAGPRGWAEQEVAAAVAAARHRDRIERLGWVDAERRAELLAAATVFAYPSRYEGFGLPPLEAMAAGVPVVASAAGAVPEAVGDAALIVPVGDADALADALATVLDDGTCAGSLAERGRARAAGFTWERTADGLVSLYEDAARG